MAAIRHIFSSHASTSDTSRRPSQRASDDEVRGRMLRDAATHNTGRPPTPPPKDLSSSSFNTVITRDSPSTPGTPTIINPDTFSLFRPGRLSRAGSIYSLSRVSFTSQISQLTAIRLPDASSLQSSIAAIPSAELASKALKDAAEQIQSWMQKASDVLSGLDAGDDAEWAAAAGRDGVVEVDHAITRFERLVEIYMTAIEDLQLRHDAKTVSADDMTSIVGQVDRISKEWNKIKKSLKEIKKQVELALEFEELRNIVLGDIGVEIDALSRMVFEMEEQRHRSSAEAIRTHPDHHVDLNELETMVHESTSNEAMRERGSKRNSFGNDSAPRSPELKGLLDDTTLLGLFARMQPLRASLDFLPMKLSAYSGRANNMFPSACNELEERREELEEQWWRLDTDADSIRREVGEDKWNLIFRNAGKQAIKMIESVERTLARVDESLGHNTRLRHSTATVRKIESYEAKKQHMCPAIERVLNIVERGVKDRLTVNGEIARLRADIRQKWQTLQIEMRSMDALLDEYAYDTGFNQQQLRDSVSTILSTDDRSVGTSTLLTPGSSPPSSGGLQSRRDSQQESQRPYMFIPKSRAEASATTTQTSTPKNKRYSNMPTTHSKTPTTRANTLDLDFKSVASGTARPPSSSSTPNSGARSFAQRMAAMPQDNRPRWSYLKKASGGDYDVSAYYQALMSKGKNLHKPYPSLRHSSAPHQLSNNTPASSLLAGSSVRKSSTSSNNTPAPASRITNRTNNTATPILNRKKSEITPSNRAAWSSPNAGNASPAAAPRQRSVSHSVGKPSPYAQSLLTSNAESVKALFPQIETGGRVNGQNQERSRTPLARPGSRSESQSTQQRARRISMIPQLASSPRTSIGDQAGS